jgi:mannose-6-phosphate isomerase-like protein (cupin superfamily)
MDSNTAENYINEPVKYPPLQLIDLAAEGAAVTDQYRNMVINRVNEHCMRLAVFDDVYSWHYHPASDELFVVVSGCLVIELQDNHELRLLPWQCATVPAMTIHRTRALGRTVNLCFEKLGAETVFLDSPQSSASRPIVSM